MLKKMGFLDPTGRPTETYGLLKNKGVAKAAIANGVRKLYAPLFESDEKANELSADDLKGLIAQVTGADQSVVKQIAYTIGSLIKVGDFAAVNRASPSRTVTMMVNHRCRRPRQYHRADCGATSISTFRCICLRMEQKRLT
jgi:hypothetical protein